MNADISPAPWTWNDGSPLQDADGNLVNSLAKSPAVRAANRRLIAAAPELLAALQTLVKAGEQGLWGAWASNTPNGKILASARAAISKAKGEA